MTDTLTKTAIFAARPDVVWTFLTDKDKLGLWYHPARADLIEGERYELMKASEDGGLTRLIWGKVLKADKPKILVTTFCIAPFGEAETRVTWTLTPVAGGTRLTLTHEGIAAAGGESPIGLMMALDHGWDEHIQAMRDAVAGE